MFSLTIFQLNILRRLEINEQVNASHPPCIHITACKQMLSIWDDLHNITPRLPDAGREATTNFCIFLETPQCIVSN